MAFQSDRPFADFLRIGAKSDLLAESAPTVNFLLEECLDSARENEFLAVSSESNFSSWNFASWFTSFGNYYTAKIDRPRLDAQSVETFSALNRDNHRAERESNQDVVRIESIAALHKWYPGYIDSADELATELRDLSRANQPDQGHLMDGDRRSRLTLWLEGLNQKRRARPAFAAPLDGVASFLALPDWATRMRNLLGLSHFSGSPDNPLPVVLCRYNLSRAERAARKAKVDAWTAIPTILEAGTSRGPSAAFFPFPKATAARTNSLGFGATVNLDLTAGLPLVFNSEMLHFPIDYGLEDFVMTGEIVDEITDDQLMRARQRHFSLLEADLRYRTDVTHP